MIKKIALFSFITFSLFISASGSSTVFAQDESINLDSSGNMQIEQLQDEVPGTTPQRQETVPPVEEYALGKVIKINDEQNNTSNGYLEWYQIADVQILTGPQKGQTVQVENVSTSYDNDSMKMKPGETIITVKISQDTQTYYYMADKYRLNGIAAMLILFFIMVAIIGRKKGIMAFVGLVFSVVILTVFIVPQISSGKDPILVALLGAFVIGLFSFYMAHGISKRTTIALVSSMITLLFAGLLSLVFVDLTKLFGTGSEEAFFLLYGTGQSFNLRGLLLAGILIGALGILDDITTAQVAVVEELKATKQKLTQSELYSKALNVGREHIASLVNTLVLAYAGASLPLLLLFGITNRRPAWFIINSEFIAEELVRTLVGSMALVMAVPIATYMAAWYFGKKHSKRT